MQKKFSFVKRGCIEIVFLAIIIFKWFLKTDKMIIFVVYTALVGIVFLVISCIEINTGANVFTGAMIQ